MNMNRLAHTSASILGAAVMLSACATGEIDVGDDNTEPTVADTDEVVDDSNDADDGAIEDLDDDEDVTPACLDDPDAVVETAWLCVEGMT